MVIWSESQIIPAHFAFLSITDPSIRCWSVRPRFDFTYPKQHFPQMRLTRFLTCAYMFEDAPDFVDYLKTVGLVTTCAQNTITHESKYWIRYDDLPQLVFVEIEADPVPYKKTVDYSPSELRKLAIQKGVKALNQVKQMKLSTADETQLVAVRRMLNEERREELQMYVDELHTMEAAGEIHKLSNMERMRISLLKVCEMMGLVEFVNNADRMESPTVQGYMNIARMLGNEAQRQLDDAKIDTKRPDDIFNKLKEIAKKNELKFQGQVIEAEVDEPAVKEE